MKKLPDIKQDFSGWYNEVIYDAELVDHAPVKGCMVIRPYGYAIWERIKEILDGRIKATGHQNASFPLFIPESFLKKEAQHVAGFAPELAVVTHAGGKQLEEPLIVRPTSETIIHYMFARWIRSWRDLPLKINQWCNVVRWEMRTRPFLRTTEFFWQEGHTAHETYDEAYQEVMMMLQEYRHLAQNYLAIPVITGRKTDQEKFPGAEKTMTFEGFMPDGKALQMGTSHLLSQSFAHAFEMKFQDREEKQSYPYLTSWGTTTRLVGALVMTHGDQKGLVLPPEVAPIQVVIIPIFKANIENSVIIAAARNIKEELEKDAIRVFIDEDSDKTPGSKFFKWELKGVPIRIELGPKDIENSQAVVVERIESAKRFIPLSELKFEVVSLLNTMQSTLFERAQARMHHMRHTSDNLADFGPKLENDGMFYQTSWCERPACETELKNYKASIRCILEGKTFETCFNCQQPSTCDVIVARSY
ncbi:MAG TPA: proline--tRNA ligase [Candidatus Babeliales bacterium]|jgi:prolyl-tRNA synthetase|nr:proline--tRNA ligase [Candidatus Babeliales bacterium]